MIVQGSVVSSNKGLLTSSGKRVCSPKSVMGERSGGSIMFCIRTYAFFVVTSAKTYHPAVDFCRVELRWVYVQMDLKMFTRALTKLLEIDRKKYYLFVENQYKAINTSKSSPFFCWKKRSLLFRHTIQLGVYGLTMKLSEYGVSREDMKFAFNWLVQGEMNSEAFSWIVCKVFEGKHWDWEDVNWLRMYAVKSSMKEYFENQSEANLKIFKAQFDEGCKRPLIRQIFKEAVKKCVELDCADCFVMLCEHHDHESFHYANLSVAEIRTDRAFAYAAAIEGNRSHFIAKICKNSLKCFCHNQDEMHVVVNTIVKRETWHMLGCVNAGLERLSFGNRGIGLLKRCVLQMLSDQGVWPHIAAMLDQWIRYCELEGKRLNRVLIRMKKRISTGQWAFSLSEVTQWCVDTGHANLAFFLSLVNGHWEMLTTAITSLPSLHLDHNLLWTAVQLAAKKRKFSTCVAVLDRLPFEFNHIRDYWEQSISMKCLRPLTRACEEQGLMHWALVLMADFSAYVLKKHQLCHRPDVLDFLLDTAMNNNDLEWNVIRALVPRCSNSHILQSVLITAMHDGLKNLAKDLLNRVDPTFEVCFGQNLLYTVVNSWEVEDAIEMVRLCISAGLSTFERPRQPTYFDCLLLGALKNPDPKIIKLLLASGAFSHKRLKNLWEDERARQRLLNRLREDNADEDLDEWKACYSLITKAAATPLRLEHSARMVISHSIGCKPGRRDRISSLPVPEPVKDLLNFEDVVTMDLDCEDEL